MDMDQGVLYILGALAARYQIVSLLLDIYIMVMVGVIKDYMHFWGMNSSWYVLALWFCLREKNAI
jgi:uncharacterized membrane protein HdeD (DUF308 family)